MEPNEIKKLLYKLKLTAKFVDATKEGLRYRAQYGRTAVSGPGVAETVTLIFMVPFSEIGDMAKFEPEMPSQLLISYIVTDETTD